MRALKIILWTIFSVILLSVTAACLAVYVVFTPERLTPIARQAADKFITCEHEIGDVELTFFSTFPRFGLRADGLLLINPKAGAPNDTVVSAKQLVAIVDVMEFLNNKHLYVQEATLDEAQVHFFIAEDGTTNLTDVFLTSPDTLDEDTTAFALPFDRISINALRLRAKAISFVDAKDTIDASLGTTELSLSANNWDDMFLSLDAQDICASLKNDTYADSLHLHLDAPFAMNLDSMHFAFRRAELSINAFALVFGGTVDIHDSIDLDVGVSTKDAWPIQPLLALVPAKFTSTLKDIDVDGNIAFSATAKGTYSPTSMPLVTAELNLTDGKGKYRKLPYTLRDLTLKADAVLNLNEGQASNVTIHKLAAKTKNSQFSIVNSRVSDLLGNMLLDLHLNLDAQLPDFAYFLPENMTLTGRAKGKANAKIRLKDLTAMKLEKGRITADLDLGDIHYAQDSMVADLASTHAVLTLPNPSASKAGLKWAGVDLTMNHLDFLMGNTIRAEIAQPVIHAELADILNKKQDYFASIDMTSFRADYEDIHADLNQSRLEAFLVGGKTIQAKLKTDALKTNIGDELKAQTGALTLDVGARYNPKEEENVLLKWNPRVKVNLKNGELLMPERLPETLHIPTIEFSYSNRLMTIDNSRIELGNSDLNLKGEVRNIGKWFRHDDILKGELELVSNHCDANQLMTWFSADEGSEEKPTAEGDQEKTITNNQSPITNDSVKTESNPFLVPTDVDLALTTHIQSVEIFNQVAKDLKGGLYIRDGKLILDEMGFVCRAAKLQLTAMYRTPRRNDLYIGLDYHMIDVDIDELLTMIPNLEEMMPMLSSFKGAAQFHMTVETYMTADYKPKMSTLRGAASLTAKDLVVLDGETFSKISKLLMFNKKTENKIDSINAEITLYKKEIDVYPLCVQMDNYMVALGGRHNTDMTFDYDINVLKPIYLGVNVSGNIDNLKIKLAKCKFAQDFRPRWYEKADTQSRELRERIKKSMERNVRIQ